MSEQDDRAAMWERLEKYFTPEVFDHWCGVAGKMIRQALPPGFPKIITLIGSTRFADEYTRMTRELTLQGHIVISVGLFGHQEGLDMDGKDAPVKEMLDELHLRKIDLCDEVHLVAPKVAVCHACWKPMDQPLKGVRSGCCGSDDWEYGERYVGDSTKREIVYAIRRGKNIMYPDEDAQYRFHTQALETLGRDMAAREKACAQ